MRIFFITTKLNFVNAGGSSDENDLMFRTLQEMGNQVAVVTAYSKINNIPNKLPYELIEENLGTGHQFGIQRGVFKLLKKYEKNADIFHVDRHVFMYGAGAYRALGGKVPVASFFNRELVSWPENVSTFLEIPKADSFFKKLKKHVRFFIERYIMIPFANYVDFFEFTNPFLEKSYNNFGLKTNGRSLIIGELFDWQKFMQKYNIAESTYRDNRESNIGPVEIIYVGRMVAGKGFDLLITAFAKVQNKDNFHLTLVGNGPEEYMLHELSVKLGVNKYITFAGYLPKDKLYKLFKEVDIFIQPRWRKDMSSMSLLTAIIFGVPSIVPEGGGLAWMAGSSALKFKDNDVNDLANTIEKFGSDKKLRFSLSENCYNRLKDDELNHKNRMRYLYNTMENLRKNL